LDVLDSTVRTQAKIFKKVKSGYVDDSLDGVIEQQKCDKYVIGKGGNSLSS
jgi:hypothetical protein